MIRVESISKIYQVWDTPLSRLSVPVAHHLLRPFAAECYQRMYQKHCAEIHALNNVSFELDQGDSLGIIGLNGSGKSTLLQIVAGTLPATSGEVSVSGRVAALLELGSGFDMEFTGKENVYLNAAILGLSATDIDARYDAIVSFADIGGAIDHPVKTYSSGMLIRLAFAVQVHVDPDILIVDEALAVGDARFQARALNKLDEILARGTTLLFVGHDLNTVRSFCNRAMLLHKGSVLREGIPDDVITDYLQLVQQHEQEDNRQTPKEIHKGFSVNGFEVVSAAIEGHGNHAELSYDDDIRINVDLNLGDVAPAPHLILDIVDQKGLQLSGRRIPIPCNYLQQSSLSLVVNMRCSFQRGLYRFRFRIVDAPTLDQTRLLSRQDDLLSIEMIDDVRDKFTGIFPVPMTCEWSSR